MGMFALLFLLTSLPSLGASPGARKVLGLPRDPVIPARSHSDKAVRALGWQLGEVFFAPHAVSGFSNLKTAKVPEFFTWYPIQEVIRIRNQGFVAQGIDRDQVAKKLQPQDLHRLFSWNMNLVGHLPHWPENYFEAWKQSFQDLTSLHSLNDTSRVLLNPKATGHLLNQSIYSADCLKHQKNFPDVMEGISPGNHSPCFTEEFPAGSVIAKLNWTSLQESTFTAYRTLSEELVQFIEDPNSDWRDLSSETGLPGEDEIIVSKLPSGKRFALTGVHFMVKNQKDWTWVTFWWSPKNSSSFQTDQTVAFQNTTPQAAHYSQCTVVSDEASAPTNTGDLKQWIGAFSGSHSRRESWCSNPYIEHGAGNLGSNCIGCHQYAGSPKSEALVLQDQDRRLLRNNFPTDYVWSFTHGAKAWARQIDASP